MNKKKKYQLKAAAHHLKPVILLGNQGLTDSVHSEIDVALKAHELIKIKIPTADISERNQIINEICQKQQSVHIDTIGHIAIIWRERPDK